MGDIRDTLNQRQKTHGSFEQQAQLCQTFKDIARTHLEASGKSIESDVAKESLEMLFLKISMILNGNPDEVDHWLDICGYSQLVVDFLSKEETVCDEEQEEEEGYEEVPVRDAYGCIRANPVLDTVDGPVDTYIPGKEGRDAAGFALVRHVNAMRAHSIEFNAVSDEGITYRITVSPLR